MVPLAKAFLDGGHDVHWAVAAEACARLAGEGFTAAAAGLGEAEGMAMFHERFPEVAALPPAERPLFMFPRVFGTIRAAPMLADLLPVVREWEPTLVIHDAGDFAGPIAAATLGVPSVTHGFGALRPAEMVEGAAREVAGLWEAQGLQPRPYGGSYDHLYLDIYPPGLQAGPHPEVPSRQPLRPVAFATAGEETLPGWVTEPPDAATAAVPLVYVTFGTVFNKDLSLITAVVAGLAGLPLRVLVTVGPGGDAAALGPQPPNVHVCRYIPQTDLLPWCAAVVSHAGSGTVLAGLAQGLPQLCIPQAADQFDNAEACTRSGAGIALRPGTATAETVREGVEKLLFEDRFRRAAESVAGEIAAMPGPNEVAAIIDERFGPARP